MGQLWDIVQGFKDGQRFPPSDRRIAQALGISQGTLSAWKNPKRPPEAENLRKLALLTGVPFDDVVRAAVHDTYLTRPAQDLDAETGDRISRGNVMEPDTTGVEDERRQRGQRGARRA